MRKPTAKTQSKIGSPKRTREQVMLHAAYTSLRWNSQAETRKKLGGKNIRHSPREISGFCRRAAKLSYVALQVISEVQNGSRTGMDSKDILEYLKMTCPGFAEETYEKVYGDTMQDLR